MTSRSDWKAAAEEWRKEQRRKFGQPPDTDTLLAYTRGKLPEAEAQRVRDYLVLYPEIARGLSQPLSEPEAQPGDLDFVSEHELAANWTALRKHLPRQVSPFWRTTSIAALLLIAILTVVAVRIMSNDHAIIRALQQPRTLVPTLLLPLSPRGTVRELPVPLPSTSDSFLLTVSLIDQPKFPRYRIDLLELGDGSSRVVWTATDAERLQNDTFQIFVPRSFFKPDRTYRLVVYGIGEKTVELSAYAVRL